MLLDSVMDAAGLSEFVLELLKTYDEELTWDVWLHKVFDKSFAEFKDSLSASMQARPTDKQLETTIQNSKSMLDGFIPES